MDHLFDAAVKGCVDEISGVSECIILGRTIPLGTGGFGLLMDKKAISAGRSDFVKRKPILWGDDQYMIKFLYELKIFKFWYWKC